MSNVQFLRRPVAPWSLWVVGAVALLWNGLGTLLWAGNTFTPEMALADLPVEHRAYVLSLPFWSTITWGLGVLSGFAGALLLLLRNKLAVPAFGLSLMGAITNQLVYLTHPPPTGFFNTTLTLCIIGIAIVQVGYANSSKRRGIL